MSRRALVQVGLVLVGLLGPGASTAARRAGEDPRTALQVPPGAARSRAARPGPRVHRPAPLRSPAPGRPQGRRSTTRRGGPQIDEASKTRRPGPPPRAARAGPDQARGVRQGPAQSSARPRGPGADRPDAGGARAPGAAPGRRRPGRGPEDGPQGRGPRLVHPGPRGLRPGRRSAQRRPTRASPASSPRAMPGSRSAARSTRRSWTRCSSRRVSDYELAQTFPAGSKERTDHLAEALKQFDDLYKNYRTQMAGLTAQMWQAKCYEEQGKIGEAIGIYKSLLDQPDPRLRPLQRFVGYFYIVALAKRKRSRPGRRRGRSLAGEVHPPRGAAVSRRAWASCSSWPRTSTPRWPRAPTRPSASRPPGRSSTPSRRSSATPRPTRTRPWPCSRSTSRAPRPRAEEIARLTYDDAVNQADEAIASHDWERAIVLLKAAIRKVDPRRDVDKANRARYNLAFCYYMNKQYLRSRTSWPSTWPAAIRRGGSRPRPPRSACRRWPRPTTPTPRSTASATSSG